MDERPIDVALRSLSTLKEDISAIKRDIKYIKMRIDVSESICKNIEEQGKAKTTPPPPPPEEIPKGWFY